MLYRHNRRVTFAVEKAFELAKQIAAGDACYNYARGKVPIDEMSGRSVFYKDAGGTIFHTYSCYARGIDMLNGAYHYLDLVPKGRDEEGLESPQDWLRHHDRYED